MTENSGIKDIYGPVPSSARGADRGVAGKRASVKNIAFLLCGILLGAAIVLGAVIRTQTLLPGYKATRARKARSAPLVGEARKLGLTYESVLSDPSKAVGKPAVWCLRRISPDETLYQGKEGKSVYMEEAYGRPAGSMRRNCRDTLLTIKKVTALELGTVKGVRLEADFLDYP